MVLTDKNNKKNSLINIAMLAFLVVLTLSSNINSALSFLTILIVFPLIMITLSSNLIFSVSSLVLVTAINFVVFGAESTIHLFCIYLIPSFIGALYTNFDRPNLPKIDVYKKILGINDENYRVVTIKPFLVYIVSFIAGTALYYLAMKYMLNTDLIKEFKTIIDQVVTQYKSILNPDDIKKLEDVGFFSILTDYGTLLITMITLKSMFYGIILYFIGLPIYNKVYDGVIVNVPFDNITLPGRPVIVLLAMIAAIFFLGSVYKDLDVMTIVNNFVIVMQMVFFIEGISLITFVLRRWKKLKNRINWFFVVVLLIFVGIVPGISLLGMINNIMNFRIKWISEDIFSEDR